MTLDKLLLECLRVPCDEAQDWCAARLEKHGYTVEQGADYTYGAGALPVCVVAHTDTVWDRPPRTVYHDAAHGVIWAGEGGLGADDRIGVYIVLRLLAEGFRPYVLFPDREECGGHGAREAGADFLPAVNVLLQFDRSGHDDFVTYSHRPTKREKKWFRRHGWMRAQGTFTDISVLMPCWGIAGANLSVGYYGQHTGAEMARLSETERTIRRAAGMLEDLPRSPLPYRHAPAPAPFRLADSAVRDFGLALDLDDARDYDKNRCDGCGDAAFLLPSDYSAGRYCDDCRDTLAAYARGEV